MTDEQAKALGPRALVAGFRVWPGCSLIRAADPPPGATSLRPTHLRAAMTGGHPCDPFARIADVDSMPREGEAGHGAWVPDFRDPATLGVLDEQVRDALNDPGASVVCASYDHARGYRFRVVGGHHHGSGFHAMSLRDYATRAEALVAALEWARGRAS